MELSYVPRIESREALLGTLSLPVPSSFGVTQSAWTVGSWSTRTRKVEVVISFPVLPFSMRTVMVLPVCAHNRPQKAAMHTRRVNARCVSRCIIPLCLPGGVGLVVGTQLLRAGVNVVDAGFALVHRVRSEERRVGKECRSRWSPYH